MKEKLLELLWDLENYKYPDYDKKADEILLLFDVVGQSEQLSCKCGLPKRKEGIGFSCMRTDCDANIAT